MFNVCSVHEFLTLNSQAMKDMSLLVSEMNETSASVSMGEVKGILVKQEDPVYFEQFSFGYTNSNINVGALLDLSGSLFHCGTVRPSTPFSAFKWNGKLDKDSNIYSCTLVIIHWIH